MTATSHDQAAAQIVRLQWGLRIGGAAMMLFFTFAAVATLLDVAALVDENGGWFGELFAWSSHEGHEYILMLAAIHITWGAFTFAAASDPVRHRLIIEFTIAGNLAHMAVMALMAIADSSHTAHLVGDVPFALVLPVALTILWLPVRRSARQTK